MTRVADALILAFPSGRSLTAWSALGRLEREKAMLAGLSDYASRVLFVAQDGPDDARLVAELRDDLGLHVDALSAAHPDPELGTDRTLEERVLARLGRAQRVVVQTMQLRDGGAAVSLLGPMRRAGIQAALVARGGFVCSRVMAAAHGPHSYEALAAGADEQSLCRKAQIVVGASESMISDLTWRHGINPARTRVIPHFVSDQRDAVLASDRSEDTVLVVGGLEPNRGVDVVLAALARLPDQIVENVHVDIVGEGPERDPLARLAGELGVRARFLGRLPHHEVLERVRSCTLLAHASAFRSQSRSVLEAMAAGCPVILADNPEFDGLVENGSTGIRIKPTPEAFAFALEALLSDREWRGLLGSAAARTVRNACGIDRVVPLSAQSYHDALQLAPETVHGRARRAG